MNTPLQSVNLSADDMTAILLAEVAEDEEGHAHIHMPNGSLWPLFLAVAVVVTMAGFLVINTNPWITIIGAPFVLVGIVGWGLQDPFASRSGAAKTSQLLTSYAEAAATGQPTFLAETLLQEAQDVADRTVTVSSFAWSAHPVKVEIEREGVVLALYGKIELEAQKKALEENLLQMPGVIDVKNFLDAEDALLNAVNARIEKLRADGKLEGAKDISVLVENYIVSLYGETPTSEMKYMLEKELVGIPGVRVVINHIGLDEDIPGNLGKTNNKIGK
ncbi:MAG TPA: BON domain-containing protein [Ktedonobacteraceae bacterium]